MVVCPGRVLPHESLLTGNLSCRFDFPVKNVYVFERTWLTKSVRSVIGESRRHSKHSINSTVAR